VSVYGSKLTLALFFACSRYRNYLKYENDPNASLVFEWLLKRLDWLIASIHNHKKPALQGVIRNLEDEILEGQFGWTRDNKDNFFITMIGAMVCFLVEEHGYAVLRYGVPLRFSKIISTASTYRQK